MSMIQCPECKSRISEVAVVCPRCGFSADDPRLPISRQICVQRVPTFKLEVKDGDFFENILLQEIPIEEHSQMAKTFGDMTWLGLHVPAIMESIANLARQENKLVADLNPFISRMIARGEYRLNVDSANQILPTIVNSSGRIVKQVRLKPEDGDMMGLCSSIGTHLAMAQLMESVEEVRAAVLDIHAEIQQDRLSAYEAAKDLFLRALEIEDLSMRESILCAAIQTASEAKCALMRNASLNLRLVRNAAQKSNLQMMLDTRGQRDISTKAADAINDLVYATASCQIECFSFISMHEKAAAAGCLTDFTTFLTENRFDNHDTLVMLNENVRMSEERDEYKLRKWQDVIRQMIEFKTQHLLEKQEPCTVS